jgi:hypothetical protein
MLLAGRLHAFVRGPGGALFQKAQRPADVAAEIEVDAASGGGGGGGGGGRGGGWGNWTALAGGASS